MHSSSEGAAKKRIFVWAPSPGGAGRGPGCERRLGGPPLNPREVVRTFVAGCQPSLSPGNGELACLHEGNALATEPGSPFTAPGGSESSEPARLK